MVRNDNVVFPIISTVIIVIISVILLFNYNEYKCIKETKDEISKLNDRYFNKLGEKIEPVYEFKVGNIGEMENIVKELKDISYDLDEQLTSIVRKNTDMEDKIQKIEQKINKKNNDINELKKKVLEDDRW